MYRDRDRANRFFGGEGGPPLFMIPSPSVTYLWHFLGLHRYCNTEDSYGTVDGIYRVFSYILVHHIDPPPHLG